MLCLQIYITYIAREGSSSRSYKNMIRFPKKKSLVFVAKKKMANYIDAFVFTFGSTYLNLCHTTTYLFFDYPALAIFKWYSLKLVLIFYHFVNFFLNVPISNLLKFDLMSLYNVEFLMYDFWCYELMTNDTDM